MQGDARRTCVVCKNTPIFRVCVNFLHKEVKSREEPAEEEEKGEVMEGEVIRGMREWRQQHPKATLREIEDEVNERLARMRAQLLEEIAVAGSMQEWEEGEGPKCPQCGTEMVKRGKGKRRLETGEGEGIEIEREYASCPTCGVGFFPSG